jgi:hypothetical protein
MQNGVKGIENMLMTMVLGKKSFEKTSFHSFLFGNQLISIWNCHIKGQLMESKVVILKLAQMNHCH